jgi:predicted secreted protein
MAPSANHTSIIGSSEYVFESNPKMITDFIKKMTQPPLTRRTRKKSVSWAPSVLAYSITHVNDMSEKYIKTVWYEPKDYKAFKKDCKESAILAIRREGLLLDSGSPTITTASFCVRGVEHIADKQVGSLRRLRRKCLWQIVLEEQRDQLTTGFYDLESYEELCHDISASALRQAHMKAMRDYEEVLDQKAKDDREQAALSKQTSSKICA